MKTLTLLRHAKSGLDDLATRDFDRTLNAKGQRAAAVMGRQLRALDGSFDQVIASPAARVVETLEHVGAGYGEPFAPAWDRRIYLASAATLLDLVTELPDTAQSVLLVGHNPGLEDLVLMLVPDREGGALRGDVEMKFPTASIARLELAIDHWSDARANTARLTHFIRPRDVDPALGPDVE